MERHGMVIELNYCISCNACTLACKAEHATQPGEFWCKVLEKESGTYPLVRREFLPVLCNHCAEAPCEEVCPSGATYYTEDGRVLINSDICIGCRACMAACPYEARHFIGEELFYFPKTRIPHHLEHKQSNTGIVQKCNFCDHRLKKGLPPACVETCPTSCRIMIDLNDQKSGISNCHKKRFRLLEEMGTEPAVYYTR